MVCAGCRRKVRTRRTTTNVNIVPRIKSNAGNYVVTFSAYVRTVDRSRTTWIEFEDDPVGVGCRANKNGCGIGWIDIDRVDVCSQGAESTRLGALIVAAVSRLEHCGG